ncbi:MAG: CDP-diacylglycerol--glycerol-3-phosphate 3-phosphatidyltransferase [Firmicutes bacterium]|nr:CDP-diacylglycerol--glycerol-3-phosphate 3-phosphatidyltransferase [Bacillota bacterium]
MNLPNKITTFRLFLIPIFVIFFFVGDYGYIISGLIFILASFTDFLDGYLARKYNETTNFGAFLDPIADKVLVFSALILLAESGIIPSWSVILIIGRETLINGFRLIAIEKGVVISASYLGKLKTVTQMISLVLLLFSPALFVFNILGLVIYWIAVIATLISGIEYIYQGRDLLSEKP